MTKNTLLNIALVVFKIIKVFIVIFFIGMTTIFIHLQTNKEFYKDKKITLSAKTQDFSIETQWKNNSKIEYEDIYSLADIKTSSLYFNYIQYSIVFFVLFLAVKEFENVIISVKKIKTFQNNNVVSFRKIAKYIFLYFLLTMFHSFSFQFGGYSGFTISLTPLILVVFSLIMAEIFKEGYNLKEENDLTI
ncbi:DUF2975 domain-containing protein [Yeosuana sp. AK3]